MFWRRVLALCSRATRFRVVALFALRVVSRLAVVLTASIIAHGHAWVATSVGVFTAATMALQRVLLTSANVSVDRDLYRATARVFLGADAIEIEEANPEREFMGGLYNAGLLVYQTGPALIGDGLVVLAIVPWLVATSPPRFVGIVGVALVVLAVASFAVRGQARRVEKERAAAFRKLLDQLFTAIDGRLEIIASGRDLVFAERFEQALARFQTIARRYGIVSALLGRVPIAAALLLVLAILALDAPSRDVLTRTFLSQALVLAACLPSVLGVVTGTFGLLRVRSQLAPFLALFDKPTRSEHGTARRELPAPFTADRIAFGYGATPVFSGVSFAWKSGVLVAIGPNGAGKSTLLRLLMGLRTPQKGLLSNGGVSIADLDLRAWRRGIAYLPQRPYLGEPYVSIRTAMHFVDPEATDEVMLRELEASGLRATLHGRSDLLAVRVGELSAGQRQRLGLARVLLQNAKLFVLDEPDANLDAAGISLVAALVVRLRSEGKMVAIAAHTKELLAIADVVVDLTP